MKILVVDDIEANRHILCFLLTHHGFEVCEAGNGEEALKAARAFPPSLIISDILMPIMDGFALCRALKQDPALKQIPFIFYTATYTEPKDQEFGLSLGADRFLVKPVENEALLKIITDCLDSSKTVDIPLSDPNDFDNDDYYKEYNQRLVQKLEHKLLQLDQANCKSL